MLRGFAEAFAECPAAGPEDLRRALTRAAELGWAAVTDPVDGTVLSVARAAATGANSTTAHALADVLAAAAAAARAALARTPEQLPQLAAAGVVDAGGRGLVLLLDALVDVVAGQPRTYLAEGSAAAAGRGGADVSLGGDGPAYEVQYLLEASNDDAAVLRRRLTDLGNEVAVVGTDGTYNVHAHVDDVGAAIEAGIEAGRPWRITVQRFADQTTPRPAHQTRTTGAPAVVAITVGPGLAALFRQAGAHVLAASAGRSPSVAEIADAMRAADAHEVVLLPNDADLHAVAEAAAELLGADGRTVLVVPTRSPMQALAALAVHDPERRLHDDAIAMSAAAAATRYAAVTHAAGAALTTAGPCAAGDVLGLIADDVAVVGTDVAGVSRGVLDRLLIGGGELVSLVTGAGADTSLSTELTDYVLATRPAVEVVSYAGGQPSYPLLVGVE
jgi:DAK2 domain fusion protein YloV